MQRCSDARGGRGPSRCRCTAIIGGLPSRQDASCRPHPKVSSVYKLHSTSSSITAMYHRHLCSSRSAIRRSIFQDTVTISNCSLRSFHQSSRRCEDEPSKPSPAPSKWHCYPAAWSIANGQNLQTIPETFNLVEPGTMLLLPRSQTSASVKLLLAPILPMPPVHVVLSSGGPQ